MIYLVTGITIETCGQEDKILLGATEFNFNDEKKQDKINPHLGILYFQKDKHGWKIFDDSTSQQEIYFNILYKGKKLISVQSKVDTPIVWGWYFPAYTFKAKIPNVGRKNYHFSGNGELKYRPLLFTTSFQFKRNNKLFYRPTKTTDSLIIYSFLKKTAADLNLGNLDTVSKFF